MKITKATDKSKKLKLPRFERNLRYDLNGLYSFKTLIAELNFENKTIKRLGWWSMTSSTHYNWVCKYLREQFDFKVIPGVPFKIGSRQE